MLPEQARDEHTCFAKVIDPNLVLDHGLRGSRRMCPTFIGGNVVEQVSIGKIDGLICEVSP